MTRLNVGASDKDSLIQDTQEFNQPRYSTLPKTTTELLKGLDKGNVSDGFNMLGGVHDKFDTVMGTVYCCLVLQSCLEHVFCCLGL